MNTSISLEVHLFHWISNESRHSFFQKHWTGALPNKTEWDQSSDFSLIPTRRATCHEHRSFDSARIEVPSY